MLSISAGPSCFLGKLYTGPYNSPWTQTLFSVEKHTWFDHLSVPSHTHVYTHTHTHTNKQKSKPLITNPLISKLHTCCLGSTPVQLALLTLPAWGTDLSFLSTLTNPHDLMPGSSLLIINNMIPCMSLHCCFYLLFRLKSTTEKYGIYTFLLRWGTWPRLALHSRFQPRVPDLHLVCTATTSSTHLCSLVNSPINSLYS